MPLTFLELRQLHVHVKGLQLVQQLILVPVGCLQVTLCMILLFLCDRVEY